MTSPAHWLIYALGGGLGHLNRAIALARSAAKSGQRVEILSNSPRFRCLREKLRDAIIPIDPRIRFRECDPGWSSQQVAGYLAELFANNEYDAFIVDTFPRGLGGELAPMLDGLKMPKVLIHRTLNVRYAEKYELHQFSRNAFDLVISPGEEGPLAAIAQSTRPWLNCDHAELLCKASAQEVLNIEATSERMSIVVVGTGTGNEPARFHQLACEITQACAPWADVRFASLEPPNLASKQLESVSIWPLLAAHRAIDLVVGAGGYNTVHEARATGRILRAIPQERMYDLQRERLSADEVFDGCEGWELLRDQRREVRQFENGASEAVRLITALLS